MQNSTTEQDCGPQTLPCGSQGSYHEEIKLLEKSTNIAGRNLDLAGRKVAYYRGRSSNGHKKLLVTPNLAKFVLKL